MYPFSNACGITRSYLMAALCTDLIERIGLLQEGTDLPADQLRDQADELLEQVSQYTRQHALLTNNRRPDSQSLDCTLVDPAFHYSTLQYNEPTASLTEQALYRELQGHIVTQGLDLPVLPDNLRYPLCELAIALAEQFRQRTEELAKQQVRIQQIYMAEEHNPLLQEVMRRTHEAGLMTASGQWEANVTRATIAYWVDRAARRFCIPHQWKWAQDRWHLRNLSQVQYKNQCGKHVEHRLLIDHIFEL